jgi:hypothetical protein
MSDFIETRVQWQASPPRYWFWWQHSQWPGSIGIPSKKNGTRKFAALDAAALAAKGRTFFLASYV